MRRDPTIAASVIVLTALWLLSLFVELPGAITSDTPVYLQLFALAGFLAIIRLLVLWVRTLCLALRRPDLRHRMIWGVLHLVLGPGASVVYYYASTITWDVETSTGPHKPVRWRQVLRSRSRTASKDSIGES